MRQMRGGKDYDPEWGKRMRGEGPIAEMLASADARLARRKFGLWTATERPWPWT